MHEQVEPAVERLAHLAEHTVDIRIGTHVALGHERARNRVGQIAHVLLDAFALVGEREFGTSLGEALRDRPRNRAPVRDAENQTTLSLVGQGHCPSINPFR